MPAWASSPDPARSASSTPGRTTWQSVPPISLTGQIGFSFGRTISATGQYNNTWHVADNFSKIWRKHAFKFGGDFRYLQINERNIYAPNGNFDFDGSETGHDVADFLLGAPDSYIQASFQVLDSRTKYGAAFAQDSWRVAPNFTLNYGLRWEVSTPWYDTQNKIQTIVAGVQSTVFPGAPKGWLVPGDPGLPGGGPIPSTLAPTTWRNFAPRLGLAWSPNASDGILGKIFGGPGKTSIRAAAGIYYTAIQDAGLFIEVADAPYGLFWVSQSPVLFDQPFLTRADGTSQTQRFPFVSAGAGLARHQESGLVRLPADHQFARISAGQQTPVRRALQLLHPARAQFQHRPHARLRGNRGAQALRTVRGQSRATPALCLSLRGTGVKAGTPQCGPNQENAVFTRPDGSQVFGTRGPLGYDFGSNTYESTNANSSYNSLQVTVERRGAESDVPGGLYTSASRWTPPPASVR